ncbi:MAG TPA: SGNH/GDSL hydrolase family protein [Solirubrobacteraceae bacterium]|nr:SGNH/GDSL hydrolase family protein [Solirubrobacteraceae bacterium]
MPAATAGPRQPVTIAVFGDSVVESATFPGFLRYGLIPELRTHLGRTAGLVLGGEGFVPAYPLRWTFHGGISPGNGPPGPTGWLVSGYGSRVPGRDGLSGYSAITRSSRATATTAIDAPYVDVLFDRSAAAGVFSVTAGGRTFVIDAHGTGRSTPADEWITVPASARTVTVHGPTSGVLTFDGVIVRGRIPAGRIGVEIENLGHSGHYLATDSNPRNLAGLRAERFDISVFMASYKRELDAAAGDPAASEAAYATELRERVGLARGTGGACVIAAPSPLPVPPSVTSAFDAVDRRVAGDDGCTYTSALSALWDPATAVKTGLTIVDGIHPAAAGYRLIARALAPVLASLVHKRAGTGGGRAADGVGGSQR